MYYVKAVPPVPAKRSMIKWVTWESKICQTSLMTYVFLLHILSHHNVGNNREKFKVNLTTTSITKESP